MTPPKTDPAAARADDLAWYRNWPLLSVCVVLVVLTVVVFGQTLGFGFVNFDDGFYVYHNARVQGGLSFAGLGWIFTHADCNLYHPLTMLSFLWDYQIHELEPGGYHFTNLFFHTASVVLLFLVLRERTGAFWRSAFVAAVFAIHPLRVESVAWISERKDVLSTFFFMLTLWAYGRYAAHLKFENLKSQIFYGLTLVCFAFALLSKPTVVTMPFVLLLLDYWPLRRADPLKRLVLEKLLLLALAIAACVLTIFAATKEVSAYANVPLPSRLANAVVSYVIYLRQFFWPSGLAVYYPRPENGWSAAAVLLSTLLLAGLTGAAVFFGRKRRWLLVGWFWYLGMLTPMIGIVQQGAFAHADRMTYLPQIGLVIAVTWLAAEWRATRALAVPVVAALAVAAWNQTQYWRDSRTLWRRALACTTNNWTAHYSLGTDAIEHGQFAEAGNQFRQALAIEPDNVETLNNVANIDLHDGRADQAIAGFKNALRLKPDYAAAAQNLALALEQKGMTNEAGAEYQRLLQIDPNNGDAHLRLGLILRQQGKFREALAQLQAAQRIEPNDPWVNNSFAWLLAACPDGTLRDGPKAVELATEANGITGNQNPLFLRTLAAAEAEAGRFPEAVETAGSAAQLAESQSNVELSGWLRSDLALYRAAKPLRFSITP